MSQVRVLKLTLAAVLSASGTPGNAQAPNCPKKEGGILKFSGAIAMNTGLQVNPDGAAASYTPGDHGFTYINNGVNLILDGKKVSCSKKGNGAACHSAWVKAETGGFGFGTPEFCSFAIEVAAIDTSKPLQNCEGDRSRFVVGNGKGKPALAALTIQNVENEQITPYISTTTLRHTVAGSPKYFDSSKFAGIVVPQARSDLVGAVAWVRFGSRSTFAIVNDTGPAFGEGSIALYQALFYDAPPAVQRIGPIPTRLRCSEAEQVKAPFLSKPDAGAADACRAGYVPKGPSDIRAYKGVSGGIQSIILTSVKPHMTGMLATVELTPVLLKTLASSAGFDEARLTSMANCLSQ